MTEPSYEQARAELGDIVRQLESGGRTLEESLALWQRGEDLAALCQRWLDGATARLDEAIAAHETAGNLPIGARETAGNEPIAGRDADGTEPIAARDADENGSPSPD